MRTGIRPVILAPTTCLVTSLPTAGHLSPGIQRHNSLPAPPVPLCAPRPTGRPAVRLHFLPKTSTSSQAKMHEPADARALSNATNVAWRPIALRELVGAGDKPHLSDRK